MGDGPQNVQVNGVHISDVYNWADLGMDVCGEYPGPHLTTEDIDIQYGYTGTRSHGMVIDFTSGNYKNIKIENVESYLGEANGLTIYKETYINLQNILVLNVNAGTNLDQETVDSLTLPNLVPRACPVDIHENTVIDYIDGEDVDNIIFDSIGGFEICDQFGDKKKNNKMKYEYINIHPIELIVLTFVVIMISVIFYVLYRSINCIDKNVTNG